jgi:hypothetical protein
LDDMGGFAGSSWHGGAAVAGDLGMPNGNGGAVGVWWLGLAPKTAKLDKLIREN